MNTFTKTCLAAVVGYSAVEAKFFACKIDDYRVYLKGFSQGFQSDSMNVNTDCFGRVDAFQNKLAQFFDSFYNYSFDNWLAPVYLFEENLVRTTEVFAACQTTNFAKQLYIRTTSWGGLIEMVTTVGMAYIKDLLEEGGSDLYNAADEFLNTDSCARTARNAGIMFSYVFNTQTPDVISFTQLNYRLENQEIA